VSIRAVSYGGGVQSTALLVLAAQKRISYSLFLMANVGDDSEHPATLRYVREVAMPYAEGHGIELMLLDRRRRDGTVETLYGRLTKPGSRSLPIPVRMDNRAPDTRSCTADFKIRVTGKELKRRGATPDAPATVALGISADEVHRANTRKAEPHERVVYPLISVGDNTGLNLRRQDCVRLIADAGLPVPPKSACYFCPFHKPQMWADMRRREPALFAKAADLGAQLIARRRALGKDPVYLTRFARPLAEVIADETHVPLFEVNDGSMDTDECDSGWCMT
jgi:hypothetical protein